MTMTALAREAGQLSKGGGSASPAGIATGMANLARKLQPDMDDADGKSVSTNPMVRMLQHAKQEMSDLKRSLDERALEFAAAKSRVQAAGSALGSRLMIDEKIAAVRAQGVTADKSELNALTNQAVAMAEPEDVRQKLKTAKEYKQYCEDAMWEALTSGNVRDDKQAVPLPTFPATIDQNDRKTILTHLVDWSQIPSVVKRYSLLVPEVPVRAMAKVMDPITGIYQEPRKTVHAEINEMYETQTRGLGLQIKSAMTSVEYTSLWKGSVNIGATGHRKLYEIDELSGLDMLYAWVSQYVLIEKGGSRTGLLVSLTGIEELYKAPAPMLDNESAIRKIVDLANELEGGVYPDWLAHGSKCVRAVVNRGQGYSDACKDYGLRSPNTDWAN